MGLKEDLQAATETDEKGRVRGIYAVSPNGDLIRLVPGSVALAASVERGVYLEGLKDGWRLAQSTERLEAAALVERERDAKPEQADAIREQLAKLREKRIATTRRGAVAAPATEKKVATEK